MERQYNYVRIPLTRTVGEWEEIERKLKDLGKSDIRSYLWGEISKLQKQFEECPPCVSSASGEKKTIQFCCPKAMYPLLVTMSRIMHRPIASIVDDFFIVPLLLPETE
jgi:hypothetical protein